MTRGAAPGSHRCAFGSPCAGDATAKSRAPEPAGAAGGLDFGWPSCEGQGGYQDPICDPTTTLPTLEYPLTGGRKAIMGGYVYRGPVASLNGKYVFSDLSGEVFAWDR